MFPIYEICAEKLFSSKIYSYFEFLKKIILGPQDPKELDPRLICPLFDILFPYLPEKIRKPLRFGVRHDEVSNRIQ